MNEHDEAELIELRQQAARDSEIAYAEGQIRQRHGDPADVVKAAFDRGNEAVRRHNWLNEKLRAVQQADEPAAVVGK